MKKLFGLLALVLGMVSCQNDFDDTNVIVGGEQEVTINVAIPEAETRADAWADSSKGAFENVDFDQYTIRYILQVYYEGKPSKERLVKYSDGKEVAFPVRLVPDRNYNFVVWADLVEDNDYQENEWDNADGIHYNTENLHAITLKDTWVAMDETRDAFTGYYNTEEHDVKYSGSLPINITLTRPFAKLRVVTTDMVELGHLGIEPHNAVATYTTKHYESFNACNGNYAGQVSGIEHTYEIVSYGETGANKTIFADYFFANNEVVKFNLDVKEENGKTIKNNTFSTDIYVRRNHLTTISGNVLTDGNNIKVEVENGGAFVDTPINVVEYSGYLNETITLASGSYIFRDLNINTTNDNAVIIEENAEVTIDIIGSVNLKAAKEAIKVSEGATLTINGREQTTRTQTQYSELVADGGIGGDVDATININNIANLTAKGHGDHAFGIGGTHANVNIENTTIDYVSGGHVQPLFVYDEKYGKSEPEGGAAIGGKSVVINNSTITKAEGGSKAAAIGNSYHQSTVVTITNSTLGDIFGGNASAAIGGSRYASDISADNKQITEINITNSTITNAVGGQYGAGIGSGYDTHCAANETNSVNKIVIVDSEITAQGGKYAAGIGTGFHAASLTGSIDAESTVNATSGEPFYKSIYTFAQHVGYGVIDPAREGAGLNVTFKVKDDIIEEPAVYTAYYLVKNIDELNAALANVVEGTKTIVFGANIEGTATVAQVEGANIIIDGNNHKFDGTLYIHGRSRHTGTETLTIKNINFESNSAKWFIDSNSTEEPKRYAHKVTIKDCTFTNLTGDNDTAVCGARFRQAYDVTIDGCEATDTFYLAWFTGCSNITIENCTATNNQEGITFGAGDTSVIKNSEIQAELFGVRLDPTDKYAHNVTIENCKLKGFIPVSARNLTEGKKPINVTFNGENTLEEAGLYDVVFSSNEYKSGVDPVGPVSEYEVNAPKEYVIFPAEPVAKIGNTEYTSIDEAIAAWTNNSTLTLLSDVTLSDVITLKSTEHHILNLGTYTMTAASGKNAFVIKATGWAEGDRSEHSAFTINADANNPGGINAGNKCIVYYKYADGGISGKDRPIIKINGGIFYGGTGMATSAGIYYDGDDEDADKVATLNITGGTFNCSIVGAKKSKLLISGGLFHHSVGSQGDSTALRLISGGTFKSFGFMTADSKNTKFWIGTSMGNSNVGVYVNKDGYLVVGGPVITEAPGENWEKKSYSSWSSYLKYSSAATYGLYFEK